MTLSNFFVQMLKQTVPVVDDMLVLGWGSGGDAGDVQQIPITQSLLTNFLWSKLRTRWVYKLQMVVVGKEKKEKNSA